MKAKAVGKRMKRLAQAQRAADHEREAAHDEVARAEKRLRAAETHRNLASGRSNDARMAYHAFCEQVYRGDRES